ncbi:MAG: 2-oxo acid dehydrogenase subunit E2 [Oscillospiraceae bacterium]|jgi:pyruvate/2-oxoglutarate dehydrogenase complex dihydrolipoamide acyltransferase (E2) component|nr:2-oxo acid dehydrogenase subunit E2 [Oscillospiraceae bacterium]
MPQQTQEPQTTTTPTTPPPAPSKPRKRRLGDRFEGRRLRSLDPLNRVAPYIMPDRAGSTNVFHSSLDIKAAEKYIRQKRVEGLKGYGMLHFFLSAYVRIVSQRPAINRFVSGQKVYARHHIEINFVVKKEFTLDGQETTVKVICTPADTTEDIFHKINAVIAEARWEGDSNSADSAARILNRIPGLFLRWAVGVFKLLDYFGKLPRGLINLSPFHGSMFITDLGSISLPGVDHHLYNFGNCPLFLAIGPKQKEFVLNREGQVTERRFLEYSLSIDERVCDGYYFASVFRMLKEIFKNPDQLSAPPETVIEDVD